MAGGLGAAAWPTLDLRRAISPNPWMQFSLAEHVPDLLVRGIARCYWGPGAVMIGPVVHQIAEGALLLHWS